MNVYIRNNLAVKAEQMDEDFEIRGEDEYYFKGKAGDYIVDESVGKRGCTKKDFEALYTSIDSMQNERLKMIAKMAVGYAEMGNINLGIANEMDHLEEEAWRTFMDNT